MGKKAGGTGAGWLATVRKVFKPASSKDPARHGKKQKEGSEVEEAAEVVSVEHFPTAETSPEVTNELGVGGAVVWLGRREDDYAEVAGARRESRHRGMGSRMHMRGRAERAAVRIQAFYRGYLARRALRALRGLVRLQALVRGHQVRRQVQRTMLCMQALVRAQDRVRARRLVVTSRLARRPVPLRHPSLLLPVARHGHGGRRSSFGHEPDAEVEGQQAPPPRHSNASPYLQQETWDHADDMLLRHDASGERAPTHAYGFQHRQRQAEELQLERRDERNNNAGCHWTEACEWDTTVRPQQHAPDHQTNQQQHGATETSYVTAVSENTAVEMEAATSSSRRSPTRDLYPVVRPDPVSLLPGYMAATQSARAKARSMAPSTRAHAARARAGSAAVNSGWSHYGGARAATNSPAESSCSGDRTPPALGGRSRPAFA